MAVSRPSAYRAPILLAGAVIVLAGIAAYHNSFGGVFAYDDQGAIVENTTIRHLWPIGPMLMPPHDGETVSGRPLLNVTLAINYAISGLNVWSYHAANLLIHVAAALLLFGILRRTFLMPGLCDRFGQVAVWLALASTLLWTVHPLQTESVTYIVQRAESLAGLFYLLTLYCVIRGAESGRSRTWYSAAVLACLLGTACKEILVTAPLIVFLYDRTFLAGSAIEAMRRRCGLYVCLAATWVLLVYLVLSTGLIFRQPELQAPDAWSYVRSQPGVTLHYLRLAVWPDRLCMSYFWPVANMLREILPAVIVVGFLLAGTLYGLIRRTAWGFLGIWFFLILAPTSSVMPLNQLVHEHRMYLSLAALAVLAIAVGYRLWDTLVLGPMRLGAGGALSRWAVPVIMLSVTLVALALTTTARNADYHSPIAIWQDGVDKNPNNPMAHNNLGNALADLGKTDQAMEQYHEALRLKPNYYLSHNNLGIALAGLGKFDEAMKRYQEALRLKPDFPKAHDNLGLALAALGRTDEAMEQYEKALQLKPDEAKTHNNLAITLAALGRTSEAEKQYREALRLRPDFAAAHNNLGLLLEKQSKTREAIEQYSEALRQNPEYADAHYNLGRALAASSQSDAALKHYQAALQSLPGNTAAHNSLGLTLAALGRPTEAIAHFREALRLNPNHATAHNNLGKALASLGRNEEAIPCLREALRLRPELGEAHLNLARALAALGKIDEAVEEYQETLQWMPDNAAAHRSLGAIFGRAGKTEEAISHYRETLRLKPDDIAVRVNLGNALARSGKADEAILHYREALRLRPDFAEAHNNLAVILAASGKLDEAIEHYGRALRLKPDYAEAQRNLDKARAAREKK